jgi:hypothetical protein
LSEHFFSSLLEPATLTRQRTRISRVADLAADNQPVPYKQYHHRSDGRSDKAGALIEPIPTSALTDERGQESPSDPQRRGQDESGGVILPRSKKPCYQTSDEANDNDPNYIHFRNP